MGDTNTNQTPAGDAVQPNDLERSLNALEQVVANGDQTSRKEQLLSKAQEGSLEKSERDELYEILGGGGSQETAGLGEDLTRSMGANQGIQDALDVSEFLREQQGELVKSLQNLGEHVQQSDQRQHEFNLVLAKAVSDVGNLVKGMHDQLEMVMGQPARGPKSRGVQTQPQEVLERGFGGEVPAGEQLNKSQVSDMLDQLMQKSMASGAGGKLGGTGEDILTAISKFEQTGQISPTMLKAVQEHQKQQLAAAH